MTAYITVDIEVNDPVGYEDYKKLTMPMVKFFGGKFLPPVVRMKPWKVNGTPSVW